MKHKNYRSKSTAPIFTSSVNEEYKNELTPFGTYWKLSDKIKLKENAFEKYSHIELIRQN